MKTGTDFDLYRPRFYCNTHPELKTDTKTFGAGAGLTRAQSKARLKVSPAFSKAAGVQGAAPPGRARRCETPLPGKSLFLWLLSFCDRKRK